MANILNEEIGFLKSYNKSNPYCVYQISKQGDSVCLQYFVDDHSSSWIKNPEIFEAFSSKYEVISGGWYGDHGRWRTLKRIFREIRCTGVVEYKEVPNTNDNFQLSIKKPTLSNTVGIEVNSEKVGEIHIKCKDVVFTEFYKLMLFEKEKQRFVESTHLFEGGLTFIGSV